MMIATFGFLIAKIKTTIEIAIAGTPTYMTNRPVGSEAKAIGGEKRRTKKIIHCDLFIINSTDLIFWLIPYDINHNEDHHLTFIVNYNQT